MDMKSLLSASVAYFNDNINNAYYYDVERIFTDSGYCYILKKPESKREVCVALHYNTTYEADEILGRHSLNDISISSREPLNVNGVLEYKGMYFGINSQDNWNVVPDHYSYSGSSAYSHIAKTFLITDRSQILDNLSSNIMHLLIPAFRELGELAVPAYYAATDYKKYIMLNVTDSAMLSLIHSKEKVDAQGFKTERVMQWKKDGVKMAFINYTADEAMSVLHKFQEMSLGGLFGFNEFGTIRDEHIYQNAFNWFSLTYTTELVMNYYLDYQTKNTDFGKKFKQVDFIMNGTRYTNDTIVDSMLEMAKEAI